MKMHSHCTIMQSSARKQARQSAILEVIRRGKVSTQSDLRAALIDRGVECDQGTVSRDIRELGIVKTATDDGSYIYAVLEEVSPIVRTTRLSVLKQMVRSVVASGNLIVIKCGPGNAPAVGDAMDHLGLSNLIGTVAGDDTLFAVVAEGASTAETLAQLKKEIGLP